MKTKGHALEEQPDGTIIPVETTVSSSDLSAGLDGQMVVCAEASECEFHKEHNCLAAQPHISDPRCGTCGYKPEANCIKIKAI